MDNRVYDALATLRNLSDEFASFEVQSDDRKQKKIFTECRKNIGKVVDELEHHMLANHGVHGGLSMGIDTGGTINTTTSIMNQGNGRDKESKRKAISTDSHVDGVPPVGRQPHSGERERY